MRKVVNKSGQVWVETVVYTLIAFALIGAVLAFARPKIEEIQDRTIIDQSLDIMKSLDSLLSSIKGTAGNQRIVNVLIKKGALEINSEQDLIIFRIESRARYSEVGQPIQDGKLTILTEKIGNLNEVTLTSNYSNEFDLVYTGQNISKIISKAPQPHKLSIENKGIPVEEGENRVRINFEVK